MLIYCNSFDLSAKTSVIYGFDFHRKFTPTFVLQNKKNKIDFSIEQFIKFIYLENHIILQASLFSNFVNKSRSETIICGISDIIFSLKNQGNIVKLCITNKNSTVKLGKAEYRKLFKNKPLINSFCLLSEFSRATISTFHKKYKKICRKLGVQALESTQLNKCLPSTNQGFYTRLINEIQKYLV